MESSYFPFGDWSQFYTRVFLGFVAVPADARGDRGATETHVGEGITGLAQARKYNPGPHPTSPRREVSGRGGPHPASPSVKSPGKGRTLHPLPSSYTPGGRGERDLTLCRPTGRWVVRCRTVYTGTGKPHNDICTIYNQALNMNLLNPIHISIYPVFKSYM